MMKRVIGIDLGGTKINTVVTDENGNEIFWRTSQTPQYGVVEALIEAFELALPFCKDCTTALGIGSPGYVNSRDGRILYSSGVIQDWIDIPLKEILEEHFALPVIVENDANVAAIGEGWLGAACNLSDYFVLTLGTGVGGAFVSQELGLLHGSSWRGGEVGHAILYPQGRLCQCGQKGCVEQYLSGTALAQRYSALGGSARQAVEVFEAVARGEKRACRVRDEFTRDLAILLVNLQQILDPTCFIIGGGLVHAHQLWWHNLVEALTQLGNNGTEISIKPALLGNKAGAYGAARLALQLLEEKNESDY